MTIKLQIAGKFGLWSRFTDRLCSTLWM